MTGIVMYFHLTDHPNFPTLAPDPSRLRKNSAYTQYLVGILQNVADVNIASGCSKRPPARPQ
jgi:hypothetical protein